jgi:Right handed beta helix region
MTLEKARGPVAAGFFCLAAALGAAARADQVYPGCAQPGPVGKVWYLDPVNGKTPADGGNGSQTAPWNSLPGVLSFKFPPGYTRPLLSSVPYYHLVEGKRVYVADQLGSPPVQPGDTIKLMSGNYGDIVIGDYLQQVVNPSFVTVEAAPEQTPVFSTLYIRSTNKWVFKGIKVQSLFGTNNNKQSLVTLTDQGAALPTSDIILQNMEISTADSMDGWTQAQWIAQARSGYREAGSAGDGTNGMPYTSCVSITGSHLRNVRFGAVLMGNNSLFSNNEIDHFGDDGMDYAASNISITHNSIHDNLQLADGNHEDAMQGQNGALARGVPYNAFSNILIDSNLVTRQTDPKLAFPTYLQGIDAFDEDWTNVTVTNNAIVTSSCWGIIFSSLHSSKIINNTAVDDGTDVGTKNPAGRVVCHPAISFGDKTHQGSPSNDVIIRNNIASNLSISNLDPNMTMDHNICLSLNGKCQIITYVNGKADWGTIKPGIYRDHNIIERNGAEGMFVGFDPAKFVFDLRLRPAAPAIGAGNPEGVPPVDITGAPRRSPVDVGAYQYTPLK